LIDWSLTALSTLLVLDYYSELSASRTKKLE